MLDGISNALSGVVAASSRLTASANNIANSDSRESIPLGGLIGGAAEPRQAYEPVRVEQSSKAEGGTGASERHVSPPYVPVFDTTSSLANDQGLVAAPNVDLAGELTELESASRAFEINLQTVQSMSDLVRKLYDLE